MKRYKWVISVGLPVSFWLFDCVLVLISLVVKLYATALGGRFPVLFFSAWLGGSVFTQLTMVFQTWYLSFWELSNHRYTDNIDVGT